MTYSGALKAGRFWFLAFLLFNGMFFGLYMASVYKSVAQHENKISDKALTTAGAIGSVCNGSSRILWASLQDKIGFKKVYTGMLVVQLINFNWLMS